MEADALAGAIVVGFAAGMASGLLGIGGGAIFVPGLILFLDQGVVEAEATSLLAIVIVAIVGTWRQRSYENVRLRDGILIGILSPLGVVAGTVLANALPERTLELLFAGVQLYFAYELARRALRAKEGPAPRAPG